MIINTANSTKNETHSSLINTLNIHDTPSSIKHKYLRILKDMKLEENKKLKTNRKNDENDHSTDNKNISK